MTDKYVSGYPPPPYYYEEYEDANIKKIFEINNSKDNEQFIKKINEIYNIYDINENKNIKTLLAYNDIDKYDKNKCTFLMGRPPPIALKNNYNIFGMNYNVERKIEKLEPDDCLYNEKKNLKEEFIRLYKMYKDYFFDLFDDIVNNRKNDKSIIKNLIKVHINLFHILANLRYHQSVNNIINVLKIQLKRRQIAIDKMKISLLNVYNYINYVQTNFSKIKMIKDEKKNTKKEKKLKITEN
ncbi:mediator of RNA polymerase II transcription subunit 7, putative [Plasmodium gallinaceum]|uniref:Mediator of RNA polymerase II transcription subunit 7 n=1 Tax=Plasmodium gallinaceum TaxID=5849 RepID=A0A1J1GLZ9_PLAGA|nr:mediator of RNA polymerase II transcription subunit 7, putative [Plasmodium gallinaceum]CRG93446.1 mediator of RNA polymerase II transcription subunit 7, putative [Plasmodium gallinaceum]